MLVLRTRRQRLLQYGKPDGRNLLLLPFFFLFSLEAKAVFHFAAQCFECDTFEKDSLA